MFRAVPARVKRLKLGAWTRDIGEAFAEGRASGGVTEDGGARGSGIYARTLVFLAARARRAAAPARLGRRSGMHWRVVLLGLSAAGSVASIACLLTGYATLALRIFIATLLVLGTLLLQALL